MINDGLPKGRQFITDSMQRTYDTCRRLSRDPSSELFDANGHPRVGANLHRAYWLGRMGVKGPGGPPGDAQSTVRAAWAAGQDDHKELGAPAIAPDFSPPAGRHTSCSKSN